jgi:RecJ-like exonuclease
MLKEKIDQQFWKKAQEISKQLLGIENFFVVGHHDADGITSCAIMVDFLRSKSKEVDFLTIKQLDSVSVKKIKEYVENKTIVFTDMGSGQLSLLEREKIENFFIFDHHVPEKEDERQLNPSFYGYDGGLDISGAGVSYMITRACGYKKMAHLAVIGALGDMQDSEGKLHSLNRIILEDAIEEETMKVEHDLRLFGRQSRPLIQMLCYASDPFLPNLSGDKASCSTFLQSLGIELKKEDGSWRNYVDLTLEERKKLTTALYIHLLDHGVPEFVIQGMVGEVYTLLKEKPRTELRDGKEFATVMNACGRQNKPEIGVQVCLGDRNESWKKAKNLLQVHRRLLREGIEYLKEKGVEEKENLYYFDASGIIDENIVGVIAGMGYGAQVISPKKPILALAEDKDDPKMLKVSGRANWFLVRKGIHLGNAMRKGSEMFGGEGGGHDIAAGARIPKDKKEEFIGVMNEIFKEQLGGY